MARLLEHHREGRPGAGAEVQAARAGSETLMKRVEQSGKKASIPDIAGGVVMTIVDRFLGLAGQALCRWYKHQLTTLTLPVITPSIAMIGKSLARGA
jgi:hypothetical protein